MNIKEWICKNEAMIQAERLAKLTEAEAPEIIIDSIKQEIARLEAGILKISGNADLLAVEFESVTQKKGRGGKPYLHINGKINYFPYAKYGRYIANAE